MGLLRRLLRTVGAAVILVGGTALGGLLAADWGFQRSVEWWAYVVATTLLLIGIIMEVLPREVPVISSATVGNDPSPEAPERIVRVGYVERNDARGNRRTRSFLEIRYRARSKR